jgi:hypothetical protein
MRFCIASLARVLTLLSAQEIMFDVNLIENSTLESGLAG